MDDREWQEKAERGLENLIEGAEVETEKMDKDGCIHTLRSKLPPNIDAIKFVLKNRSKGKWADKVEITQTQLSVNLTASYKEVKDLMEKERRQSTFLADNQKFIDAEVKRANNSTD